MAVMHPVDIENYDYTQTEKAVYDSLQNQLSDRYQVFYSVRWFDIDENNHRIDSESDFLVFDPSFGFITIEVKGGTGINVVNGEWVLEENYGYGNNSSRRLKCSPYEQAEKSMRHFKENFDEEFNQNFNGVYGFAVAFPSYAIDSPLAQEAPLELTIDINDMGNLARRINEIFHYWKSKRNINIPFSQEQRTKFINVVNKRISLSAAAGALIPVKEKEFSKIDFVQESVLDFLHNYKQAQIVGGAGTGKTFIGIKKALRDCIDGKKVLFVCCNSELSKYVSDKIPNNFNICCCTYEELMLRLLGEQYVEAEVNGNGNKCCFELLNNIQHSEKYDSIIVDEAQDFDEDMGLSIRSLLKSENDSTLYVFYDKNQNVFDMAFENAFLIDTPPYVLRYNIRNTGSIYNYAVEKTSLGSDTKANSILGVNPEEHNYSKKSHAIIALSNIVNRLVQKEYVNTKSIVIVSDVAYDKSILANEQKVGAFDISFKALGSIGENEICFKTAEEFKGLESNIVIYLIHEYEGLPAESNAKQKEYVALTRARYYLYILKTKCKIRLGD